MVPLYLNRREPPLEYHGDLKRSGKWIDFRRVSIALTVSVLCACGARDTRTPDQHVQLARKAMAAGRANEALIELKSALQAEPKNVKGRLLAADAYILLNQGPSAEAEIDHAQASGASPETLWTRRGRAYALQGNFEKIVRELPATPSDDSDETADRLELRGDAQLQLGRMADALTTFDSVLELRSTSSIARLGKARIAATKGDAHQATALIDAVLRDDPKNVQAYIFRGDLQSSLNDLPGATKYYESAVAVDKNSVPAHLALASALIQAKKLDEAKKHLAAIKAVYPLLPAANYLEAMMFLAGGRKQEALESGQKVLAALPNYPPAIILVATTQHALGSEEAAEVNSRRFLQAYPNNVYGRKLLAAILLEEKQPAKASEILEPLLTIKDADVLRLAAGAYLQSNQAPKAVALLQRAATVAPDDASLRMALGVSTLASGEVDRAIKAFESLVDLGLPGDKANALLIVSLMSKGDQQGAIKAALEGTRRTPDAAPAFNLLGGAYQNASKFAEARAAFEKSTQLDASEPSAVINLARLDLSEGKTEAARGRLAAFTSRYPKNVDVALAVANLEFGAGNDAEAVRRLQQTITADPLAVQPRVVLLRYFLQRHDLNAAGALARDSQAKLVDNKDLLGLVAEAQGASGDRSGAMASYTRLAALAPTAPILVLIARQNVADNNLAAAVNAYEKALTIEPRQPTVQLELGEVLVQMKRFDEAIRVSNTAKTQNIQPGLSFLIAGNVYAAQMKFDAAAKSYEEALRLSSSGVVASKLYAAQVQAGQSADAERMIAAWMKAHRQDVVSRLYLAATLPATDRRAQDLYEEVLQVDPRNVTALNERAIQLGARNDPRALDLAKRAYAESPGIPAIADTYGWLSVKAGRLQEGLQILQQVVRNDADYAEARYHLAVAQLRSGDKAAAKENARKSIESKGSFVERPDAQILLESL